MTRYCKSCGSASKTQSPLFITFIAVFFERSVGSESYSASPASSTIAELAATESGCFDMNRLELVSRPRLFFVVARK